MDHDFHPDEPGLNRAVALLCGAPPRGAALPDRGLPEIGLGAGAALEHLAATVLGGAAPLGAPLAFAHMDPPTPSVARAATLWAAALNQNLCIRRPLPPRPGSRRRCCAGSAPRSGCGEDT
jgi:L-2,4-diaminobutyrate decarboxylase